MRTRFAALIGAAAGTALVLLATGGCEAIVGDSLGGTVHCSEAPGVDPTSLCPSGQACTGGVCKPSSCTGAACGSQDGGHEATLDAPLDHDATTDTTTHDVVDANPPPDAKETSSLLPLGATCSVGSQCATGVCGTSTLLTSNVQTPEMGSVCTKACCSSGDCDDPTVRGFVCYPSVGGNYCVDPTWISLPAVVGTGLPGASCGGAGDCRSSVCAGSICQDACCVDGDCGSGTVCQYSTLDDESSFNCGPSGGTLKQGGDCNSSTCQSSACISRGLFVDPYCMGPCCSDSDCNSLSGGASTSCNWNSLQDGDGGILLRGCSPTINPGGNAFNTMCGADTDCASGLCYKKTSCTTPCCHDADCAGGWKCSYGSFTFSLDTVDLQVCVPPS